MTVRQQVVEIARTRLGQGQYQLWPPKDGAPDIVDCSSFVQWAFAQAGIELPRYSRRQYDASELIDPGDVAPGDLLFRPGRKYNKSGKGRL